MSRLNILVVGIEKELPDFEEAVEACKRVPGVGPIKVFSAHRAIDAVSKLGTCVSTCGSCQGVFLSHHFSAKGKEEYAELIRKLLRDKHPDVPIICWGVVKKGGEQGKDYHYGLDWKAVDGPAPVAKVLIMLKNGEIVPQYHHKGRKSVDEPRKSLDVQAASSLLRRKSLDAKAAPAATSRSSLDAGAANRKSGDVQDGKSSPVGKAKKAPEPAASPRASVDVAAVKAVKPQSSMSSPRGSMDVNRVQAGSGSSYSGMVPMTGMTPMTSAYAVNGMAGMSGMGSMGGMGGMSGMGGMGGMGGMSGMGGMGGMGGMMPMNGMSGMKGTAGLNGMSMAANGMGVMSPRSGAGAMGLMGPMGMSPIPEMPRMTPLMMPMNGMATQGMGLSSPSSPAPAPLPQQPAAAGDGGPPSNAPLIRALADEVTRLRLLVEEKRAREARADAAATAGAQAAAAAVHPLSSAAGQMAGGLSMGVVRLE